MSNTPKRVGILTGGGDAPGLNAVIRAAVHQGIKVHGFEMVGILDGWKGMMEGRSRPLDIPAVSGITHRGGTMLYSSRTNPFKIHGGLDQVKATFETLGLHALIACGGEDTLGVANMLFREGLRVVGVPKTIDNDLDMTDFTFGFDTAINVVMNALDGLHTTAESHKRVMVVEIMGRHAGHICLYGAIAGGADVILVPERPFDLDAVCEQIKRRHATGKTFSLVAVAEGAKLAVQGDQDGSFVLQEMAKDAFGHVRLGGIGHLLAEEIEKRTGFETRHVVLGHLQRSGSPTAFDRILGTRFGAAAADLVNEEAWGMMVALAGTRILRIPIEEAVKQIKLVPDDLIDLAEMLTA